MGTLIVFAALMITSHLTVHPESRRCGLQGGSEPIWALLALLVPIPMGKKGLL